MLEKETNRIKVSKNFTLKEFQSPDIKAVRIMPDLIKKLQAVRDKVKKPMRITSGYRTKEHNKNVGGVNSSLHLIGAAADVSVVNHDLSKLMKEIRRAGFKEIIYYSELKIIHCGIFSENPTV